MTTQKRTETRYGNPEIAYPNEILRTVVGSGVHGIAIEGTDDHDEVDEKTTKRRAKWAAEAQARRDKNGAQINERTRAWRDANRERYNQNARAFYARNAERLRTERKERYDADPEKHRQIARQAHARRMQRDPEQYRAWVRARYAREQNAAGSCTAEEWIVVLDTYGRACLGCGAKEDLTQDHVIPLTLGGTHWPWNLQPLCRACNSAKGARSTADYRPDGGEAIRIILEAI